jgi:hypothetical protein
LLRSCTASQHLYPQFVDAVAAAISNWPASFSAPAAPTDAVPLVVKAASVETPGTATMTAESAEVADGSAKRGENGNRSK